MSTGKVFVGRVNSGVNKGIVVGGGGRYSRVSTGIVYGALTGSECKDSIRRYNSGVSTGIVYGALTEE